MNQYIEFYNLHDYNPTEALAIMKRAHVFTWTTYPEAMQLFSDIGYNESSAINYKSIISNDQREIIRLFNDKKRFKDWMVHIGLGRYVGDEYTIDGPKKYPLMFKLIDLHSGEGVQIVKNEQVLKELVSKYPPKSYLLEEALTGIANTEGTSWGSAYKGKLLSLRCAEKKLDYKTHGTLYVMGSAMPNNTFTVRFGDCGRDIIDHVTTIVREAGYTGPFCLNIKPDNHMMDKYMEINARICGTTIPIRQLFLSTYIPLALAAQVDLKTRIQQQSQQPQHHHLEDTRITDNKHVYFKEDLFIPIQIVEQSILEIGSKVPIFDYDKTTTYFRGYSKYKNLIPRDGDGGSDV